MKKILKIFLLGFSVVLLLATSTFHTKSSIGVVGSISHFKSDTRTLTQTISTLGIALSQVDHSSPESVQAAKAALANSRLAYKHLEYFLEYFFPTSCRIYNRAPKNEIEEPFMEYQAPAGFQYIETLLFDSMPEAHRSEFQEQIQLLSLSANDLNSLLYQFSPGDAQILESVRLELIRITALGISGFDAPLLKTGIRESGESVKTMRKVLQPYLDHSGSKGDSVDFYLDRSMGYLDQNPDFDSFDRMNFLVRYFLPLQRHFARMVRDMDLSTNKYGALDYDSGSFFDRNSFQVSFFSGSQRRVSMREIALGKRLFFERRLSGNDRISCAGCHMPENYFSDGLAKSVGLKPGTFVNRNAPSLLYAGFQHSQFWDGRVKSLEQQIEAVIADSLEMNGDIGTILRQLNQDAAYKRMFRRAFPKNTGRKITQQDIYQSIASYIRTLNPYNSPFDRYLEGDHRALNARQIAGFNLFMGRAQCGTCHFAPLFNGLIPPAYLFTEFEILGTTRSDDLANPIPDPDDGKYASYPIIFYKNAFKTPSVRNSAVTGPYMHHGAFKTLESVMDFYDQGGGAGLGLDIPNQTLSSVPLKLTDREKGDLVSFLQSLTDDISNYK
jgi:cytochrome c peroxidase